MLAPARPAATDQTLLVDALDGVCEIPPEEWDRLLQPGQGGLRQRYLCAWEAVELQGLAPRPVVARDAAEGRIRAAAPGYLYDLDPSCLKRTQPPWLVDQLRRFHDRLLMVRILELGGPAALTSPLMHEHGLSAVEAAEILLPQALAEAHEAGAQVVVAQDFTSVESECAGVLRELGFAAVPVLPTVVLELGFESFEEYLGCMRAQYRRRARRVLEQSGHLRVERMPDFAALAGQLARLSQLVFLRAGEIRREVLTEEYFRRVAALPHTSLLVLRRPDGSMASFALLMGDRPWLQFLNCGFEEQAGREEAAYFRLLYEIVRVGIEDGFERINFGLTTLPPKLDAGGVPVPLVAWMRYHRPFVQSFCAAASQRLLNVKSCEARNVFRRHPRGSAAPPGGVL